MTDAPLFVDTDDDLPRAAPPRAGDAHAPLAARMRPRTLDDVVGQQDALGPGTPLRTMLERGELTSVLLWGPPGVGKTSLATVIAHHVDAVFQELSAVTAGVRDVRRIIDEGRARLELRGRRTVLFVDEIHRFNAGQQDALLPGVEAGWVVLVGATTQNPFFELTAPLLSRCLLVRLESLEDDDVAQVVRRALTDPRGGHDGRVTLTDEALAAIVAVADGDARSALGALEAAVIVASGEQEDVVEVDVDAVTRGVRRYRYDRAADHHHDQVSAFIKSMRGSDPDAAVYWLLRMLESGEDPRFLARRMVIFASEDVGLADRQALPLAVAAFEALDRVGLPEARYALTHAAISLAVAPKSNGVARALATGLDAVRRHGNLDVPAHLRAAGHRGAEALGHGVGYDYPHDHPDGFAPAQRYLPECIDGTTIYEPSTHGHEGPVADRVAQLRDARRRETAPGGARRDDRRREDDT